MCVCVCVSLVKSRLLFITGEYKSLVLDCSEGSANSLPRYKQPQSHLHTPQDLQHVHRQWLKKKLKSVPVISLSHYTIPDPFSLKGILWGCHTKGQVDRIQQISIFFSLYSKICAVTFTSHWVFLV